MNNFVKSLMEEKNLKQKELAEILGISSSMISQWNNEATNVGLDSLFCMSKLFHVTVDELLEGKRSGESLEDKWKREYYINEDAAKNAFIDGEKDTVLRYLNTLHKVDEKFFKLFEKKVTENISVNQAKELRYLRQFYGIQIPGYKLDNGSWLSNSDKEFDDVVLDMLIKKIGRQNKDEIIWNLKKIYRITHYGVDISENYEVVPVDSNYENFGEDPLKYLKDDEDIFYAVYNILPPIKKDKFITKKYHEGCSLFRLHELIKRGGNILYMSEDFTMPNYSHKELACIKGELKPALESDKIHALLVEIYSKNITLSYEQYQVLINYPRMKQIEMEVKFKAKSPVTYWEYIKKDISTLKA